MPTVYLGNHAAMHKGKVVDGERVTTVHIPDDDTHAERMRTLTHEDGVWNAVSGHDAPRWVASDDDDLAAAIAKHYDIPVVAFDGVELPVTSIAEPHGQAERVTDADIENELLS